MRIDLADPLVKSPGIGIDQVGDRHIGHLHIFVDVRPAPAVEPGHGYADRIIRPR